MSAICPDPNDLERQKDVVSPSLELLVAWETAQSATHDVASSVVHVRRATAELRAIACYATATMPRTLGLTSQLRFAKFGTCVSFARSCAVITLVISEIRAVR